MVNVYAWPPVATVSKEWTVFDPVQRTSNAANGASRMSATQRRRKICTIEASSRFSPYQAGAGYMESLKRLLKGGVDLVRLTHRPRVFDHRLSNIDGGDFFGWVLPPDGFTWEDDNGEFDWFAGEEYVYTVTTVDRMPAIRVTGLPARGLIALPGQFITLVQDGAEQTIMVIAPSESDSDGVAHVKLEVPANAVGFARFGVDDTGVFEADEMPRAIEPGGTDWSYTWRFTQVYADERGAFVERPNWWRVTR